MTGSQEETLRVSLDEAKRTRQISITTRNLLFETFGARFKSANIVVEAGRVRRMTFHPSNRTVWLVRGKEKEYLVLSHAGFCSCEDFYFRVISREETLCYHLLAQRLAKALGKFSSTEESDSRYDEIVDPSVTELEHSRKLAIRDVETIRLFVVGILADVTELPFESIVGALTEAGFPALTRKHLSAILAADKRRRFASNDGYWSLRSREDK